MAICVCLLPGAAAHATSGAIAESCTVMEPHFAVELSVTLDTDLPAAMAAGSSATVVTTAAVTLPESLTSYIYATGARSVAGLAQIETDLVGPGLTNVDANIETTSLPSAGPVTVRLTGLPQSFAPKAPGPTVVTGYVYMTALRFTDSGGRGRQTIVVCSPKATTPTQDLTIDTVSITPPAQASTTTVAASYAQHAHKVRARIRVALADGTAATGRVRVDLRRAGRHVRTTTVTLGAKGTARAVFRGIRRSGRYIVKARYAGNAAATKSVGKASLRL